MTETPPAATKQRARTWWLRTGVDYCAPAASLIAFLITRNFEIATWWTVGFSVLAIVINLAVDRRIAPLPIIYGGTALVFGSLTLIFHDKAFIKMKPTFVDTALGAAMLIGLALGKSPLQFVIGEALPLSEASWRALTFRFGLFFLALAILNEVVWRTQPDSVWLLLRFPGALIISVLFSFTQLPMMLKDAKASEAMARAVDTQP